MVQPFVLPPTHGNQLWVYDILESLLIIWSRKKPPVQRKFREWRGSDAHWGEREVQTFKHITLFLIALVKNEMEAALQENGQEDFLVAK
jgi:hypothetical protein